MATLFRRGLEKHIRQNEYQNFFSKLNMLQFSAELKTSHSYDIYFTCDSSVRKNDIQEFQQHTHTHCIKFPLISFTILQPQPPLGRNDFGEREEKQPQSPPPQQWQQECHLHDAKQETL